MAEPIDALESFTHLADNLSGWLTKVNKLAIQVADQHSQYVNNSLTRKNICSPADKSIELVQKTGTKPRLE